MTSERARLLLSAQAALLGAVTDSLLAVSVDFNEGKLDIAFYVEGYLTDEDRETFQIVGTELYAYFGTMARGIEERFIEKAQQPLHGRGHWVFIRSGCRVAPSMDS